MKRIRWIVLGAALLGPGCLGLPFHAKEDPRPISPPVVEAPPPPPAVTADGITEANARDRAQALAREIDYAGSKMANEP